MSQVEENKNIVTNFYHFLFTLRDGKVLQLKEYLDTELATDVLCTGQRPT